MELYEILKNGKSTGLRTNDLDLIVATIRQLESSIDRLTEHSPYTIGKVQAIARMVR